MRLATSEAAKGWENLCQAAPANTWTAWIILSERPINSDNIERQHPLFGKPGTAVVRGQVLDQWQYEVTSGGRIWYCPDEDRRTVWITFAGTGHPKATD